MGAKVNKANYWDYVNISHFRKSIGCIFVAAKSNRIHLIEHF